MAVVTEEASWKLTRHDEHVGRNQGLLRERDDELDDDDESDLTDKEKAVVEIARYCMGIYEEGVKAREPFETFDMAWDMFQGRFFPSTMPKYKATINVNKIRAFIIFLAAVMTDNKPRITVDPLVSGTEEVARLIGKVVDRDWDDLRMQAIITQAVIFGLIWGNGFVKLVHNPQANNGKGAREAYSIPPYRIFANRTARTIKDAEYIIHIEDQTLGWIARNYPRKINVCKRYAGARIGVKNATTRDLLRDGDSNSSQSIDSPQNVNNVIVPPEKTRTKGGSELEQDVIEVGEFWFRDDISEPYQRQVLEHGKPKMKQAIDEETGLPKIKIVAYDMAISPIDGQPFMMPLVDNVMEPVMETAYRLKYPNGRLVVMAGPIVLRDIPNPFQTDGFPFAMWRPLDLGTFWGEGDALNLKDQNIAMVRLISQLYDIIEKTGNPSYKILKNAGIDPRSIKNKAGQLIPLDDMSAMAPLEKPQIPGEIVELFNLLKQTMGETGGLQDSVMGSLSGGNTAFATIDQLQESGAAPVRLKVRNMEEMINRIGELDVALIQQFDTGDRPLRERVEQPIVPPVLDEDGEEVPAVPSLPEAQIKFTPYTREELQGPVQFSIVPVSSLSTSPAGMWNRYMALFKDHLIDAQAFHEKFKLEGYRQILARMKAEASAKANAKQKPGPKPGPGAQRTARKGPQQRSNLPSRAANSAVR